MKIEDLEVSLRPHVGTKYLPDLDKEVEVVLPQQVVFIDGVWAGYVGNEPGSQINIILGGFSPDELVVIKGKVEEKLGWKASRVNSIATLEENNVEVVKQPVVSEDDVI